MVRLIKVALKLGLARVSKGCHMKFRGHNFESCVTNCAKISFFSLRSRYGKFRGFHPSYYKIRSVSDLQNPTGPQPHHSRGVSYRFGGGGSYRIERILMYRDVSGLYSDCILMCPVHVHQDTSRYIEIHQDTFVSLTLAIISRFPGRGLHTSTQSQLTSTEEASRRPVPERDLTLFSRFPLA